MSENENSGLWNCLCETCGAEYVLDPGEDEGECPQCSKTIKTETIHHELLTYIGTDQEDYSEDTSPVDIIRNQGCIRLVFPTTDTKPNLLENLTMHVERRTFGISVMLHPGGSDEIMVLDVDYKTKCVNIQRDAVAPWDVRLKGETTKRNIIGAG